MRDSTVFDKSKPNPISQVKTSTRAMSKVPKIKGH